MLTLNGLTYLSLQDAPAPMPKDTNLDVIRVLAGKQSNTQCIFIIEQAVGGVFYKSSELISPYNNLLSCRFFS
ncbi:unnamed protein product [Brassica napus]|uniref:(rape) hypothetical protein n=1 Tax=Brassica napus TaxID=3708 RepID=A0A816XJD0_BRANA|nr:unnamed protein product [Brassica napus]